MKPLNQDEISMGQAACIAVHKSARTDPDFFLNATRRLKHMFQRMCNSLIQTPEDLPRPTEFPPDIAAFQVANPRWYELAFQYSKHAPCPLIVPCEEASRAESFARLIWEI